jgi:hypothetical protein
VDTRKPGVIPEFFLITGDARIGQGDSGSSPARVRTVRRGWLHQVVSTWVRCRAWAAIRLRLRRMNVRTRRESRRPLGRSMGPWASPYCPGACRTRHAEMLGAEIVGPCDGATSRLANHSILQSSSRTDGDAGSKPPRGHPTLHNLEIRGVVRLGK